MEWTGFTEYPSKVAGWVLGVRAVGLSYHCMPP